MRWRLSNTSLLISLPTLPLLAYAYRGFVVLGKVGKVVNVIVIKLVVKFNLI